MVNYLHERRDSMKIYDDLVYRGLIKDISSKDLIDKLNNESITFYIGTDPTGDSMHIGHFSSFLIAKRLKDAGHNPILLVGGATGQVGDPKQTSERDMITKEKVLHNVLSLSKQAKDIFGFEVVNNFDWCKDINFIDFLRDYGNYFSVNYMLDKDTVRKRLETGISYKEFSYMIMQALDFEYLYKNRNCILQVAGSDQWGNITAGIDLIRKKNSFEAYGFTMPLIVDKNGNKFGKTEGNALWLDINKTSAYEMYQFLINSDDSLVIDYLKKLTFLSKEEIEEIEVIHKEAPEKRIAQIRLCKEVITFLHGEEEFNKAKKISACLFNDDIYKLSGDDILNALSGVTKVNLEDKDIDIATLLVDNNICSSKREAREFILAGAISINNKKISIVDAIVCKSDAIDKKYLLIKKGKKNYYLGIYN